MLIRLGAFMLALLVAAACFDASAARLGRGQSVGRQSPNVTQREAQRSAQPNPAQAAPANAPAAGPRWGSVLGGIATGLGFAWLARSLGFGESFGQFLVVLLFVIVAMTAFGWLARLRRAPAPQPYRDTRGPAPDEIARPPRQYNPEKIGNDASARPWERAGTAFDAARVSQPGALRPAAGGAPTWGIPADFDRNAFIESAKQNFLALQEAWDGADMPLLRSLMTDEMVNEISAQLAERERQLPGQVNRTEVLMLRAQLLGIEDLGTGYLASVEFSGMIREEPSAGPSPFREVWNMSKPKDGATGWLVAGVQALQ